MLIAISWQHSCCIAKCLCRLRAYDEMGQSFPGHSPPDRFPAVNHSHPATWFTCTTFVLVFVLTFYVSSVAAVQSLDGAKPNTNRKTNPILNTNTNPNTNPILCWVVCHAQPTQQTRTHDVACVMIIRGVIVRKGRMYGGLVSGRRCPDTTYDWSVNSRYYLVT